MKKWAIYLSLCLGLILAFFVAQPPSGEFTATNTYTVFFNKNVLSIIESIAQDPHPLGSAEHDRVRDLVGQKYEQLGLKVEISDSVGLLNAKPTQASVAPVSNILALMEGEDRGAPAVLVMSHYDTVIHSPGAADDALGVAVSLEIARALRKGPKPKRDVIFLVTDAEEAGLLGAQAFFTHHALKDHVGVVINMEARGDAGRVNMFETGPQNAGLIAFYAKEVGTPSANSLSTLIYRMMPNGTDLTEANRAQKSGLNFAMIGHENAYHTPISTPRNLDRNSVHHMGTQVFSLVYALSQAKSLPEARPNAIYSDFLGLFLIHYDDFAGAVLLGVVAVVLLGTFFISLQAQPLNFSLWIKAKSGSLVLLVLPALYLWMVGNIFSSFDHGQKLTHFSYLFAGTVIGLVATFLVTGQQLLEGQSRKLLLTLTALMSGVGLSFGLDLTGLVIALVALMLILLTGRQKYSSLVIEFSGKPRLALNDLWRASLLINLCLALLAQILAPEATPPIVWPLALSSTAAFVHFVICKGEARVWAMGLYALFAVVALGQAGALGITLYEALGVDIPLVLLLIGLVVMPNILALYIGRETPLEVPPFAALNLAVVAFMILAYCYLAPPSAKAPQATSVIAVQTKDANYLVSGVERPDRWVKSILGKAMRHSPIDEMGKYPQWASKIGPSVQPSVKIDHIQTQGLLSLKSTTALPVKRLGLRLTPDMDISLVSLNGVPLKGTLKARETGYYQVYLPEDKGVELVVKPSKRGKIRVVAQTLSDQWPSDHPLPVMPEAYMASGLHGLTLSYSQRTIDVN